MTARFDVFGLPEDAGLLTSAESPYRALLPMFWFLEGHNIDWAPLARHLDALLLVPQFVVLYEPWWPKVERRRQAFARILGSDPAPSAHTAMAIVSPGRSVTDVLGAYEECGGAYSGQWLIAAPSGPPDVLISNLRGGFGQAADRRASELASHLLCALTFDEGAQSDLFVRRDHSASAAFLEIVSALQAR